MNTNLGASAENRKMAILDVLAAQLKRLQWTLMTAESCTGGGIGQLCTEMAGSSEWFEGGIISYSNRIKMDLLGVPEESLLQYGAVSEEVARHMVSGLVNRTGVKCAIAVTGIAGPGGGSLLKPVGTVWMAWGINDKIEARHYLFEGSREDVRKQTIEQSLLQLSIFLQEVSNQG
ncbi:CinA family protein [Gynuella sp.]|uniref:CinA family protein n=1 Tax=Gynuella sp. TaxID=2969146 RepID=UPI003D0AD400